MSAQIIPFPRSRRMRETEAHAVMRECLEAQHPDWTPDQVDVELARMTSLLQVAAMAIRALPPQAG